MNFRSSRSANMSETVFYNALPKDPALNMRSTWHPAAPLMCANDNMCMLGSCSPSQAFNAGGYVAQAARLVQAGKSLASPSFMPPSVPPLQVQVGAAGSSGLMSPRDYHLSKASEVSQNADLLAHARLPFLNLQAAAGRSPSTVGLEELLPSFMDAADPADFSCGGRMMGAMDDSCYAMSNDMGLLQQQQHFWAGSQEDCWNVAFTDADSCVPGDMSSHDRETSSMSVAAAAAGGGGSQSSGGSEVMQPASGNTKRQLFSWQPAMCDASSFGMEQLPTSFNLMSSSDQQVLNQCLPAESSTGTRMSNSPGSDNMSSIQESRLRSKYVDLGHSIGNIQQPAAAGTNVSSSATAASGSSPRSVLTASSNSQADAMDAAATQQQSSVMTSHLRNLGSEGSMASYPMVSAPYQPCANSQLSQQSRISTTFSRMDGAAIVSSSSSDSAGGLVGNQLQLSCGSDVKSSSGGVLGAPTSFLDGMPAFNLGEHKVQQQQEVSQLPNLSSLGISNQVSDSASAKGEFLSQPSHGYARENLSWPAANQFHLGTSCGQPMPTLDSLSSNSWAAGHSDTLLHQSERKAVGFATGQPNKLNSLAPNPGRALGHANLSSTTYDSNKNDSNLRKRLSDNVVDPACKRLKDNQQAGLSTVPAAPASTKPSSGHASQKSQGPALNTNLKPRARQGSANDPQSIAARHRRERISERLKVLQDLVPNGSKVDLVTMLEKAIGYVKFLQLQVKFLMTEEYWSDTDKGCSAMVEGMSPEAAARMLTETLEAAVKSEKLGEAEVVKESHPTPCQAQPQPQAQQ